MAKQARLLCTRCEGRLTEQAFCPSCGYPTPWATHDERVEYELGQWSNHQRDPVRVAARPAAHTPKTRERRWFRSRRSTAAVPAPPPAAAAPPQNLRTAAPAREPEVIVSAAELRERQATERPRASTESRPPAESRPPVEQPEPAARATTKTAKTTRTAKTATVARMRAARRIPSVADIEEIAAQGPPMVRILRLINARIALLEAQVEDEEAAAIG